MFVGLELFFQAVFTISVHIRADPPDGPLSLMGVDCGGIMFPSLDYSDSKQLGSAQRNGQISSSLYPSRMARILRPAELMRSCLKFIQHDAKFVCVCLCVFYSSPEPRVRYGVLPGERVGGEHRPRQERELDVHPERQHAGETLLQCLGLLPTVSFNKTGTPISSVVTSAACFKPLTPLLRYDHETQHAFVGDYSGQITLLKLEKQTYSTITTLKGHEGKDARPHRKNHAHSFHPL